MTKEEIKKEYAKNYYLKNKECLLAYRRQHYLDNKEHYHERISTWVKENPLARKNTRLKNMYNITIEDYKKLFDEQNGCCVGCGLKHSELKRGLVVDHDHKTGKVRGLLCDPCNRALGGVRDDIKILKNLIKYLEDGRQVSTH